MNNPQALAIAAIERAKAKLDEAINTNSLDASRLSLDEARAEIETAGWYIDTALAAEEL